MTPVDQRIVNVGYSATGAIVGNNAILTCAHAIFKRKNGVNFLLEPTGVQIVNSYVSNTDDESSRKKLVVTGYHIPEEYTKTLSSNYDYAIITVKIDNGDGTYSDLSEYGHFDMGIPLDSLNNKSDDLKKVRVSGFFYDIIGYNNGTPITQALLKTSTGTIYDMDNIVIKSYAHVFEGTSGGPVYTEKEYNGQKYQTIIAINDWKNNKIDNYSIGRRIDKMILKFALSNPNVDDDFN